jgi:regulator of protease activity HflC (stomatin/prohibitin superfamily)
MTGAFVVFVFLALFVFYLIARTAVVVPQQHAFVVERLGRFAGVLDAGFHILVPFVDVIRYRHVLKEQAMDIPEQVCITKDNVQVAVDGILYLKVMDPERASYGISNYTFAITQLAQTTLRSEIGKIDLDRTFEERTYVNTQVVTEVDKASEAWGVKVLRYEIKNITPPQDILAAMEKQMRAEREKRAVVLQSEGERDAAINNAEGAKQQVIKARRPPSSSASTRPKARRPPSSRWLRPRPRASARWRRRSRPRAASRRCSSAWPSNT